MSLAWEKAESNIMQIGPRKVLTERLVSKQVLLYAYFQAGIILTAVGLFVYFMVWKIFFRTIPARGV